MNKNVGGRQTDRQPHTAHLSTHACSSAPWNRTSHTLWRFHATTITSRRPCLYLCILTEVTDNRIKNITWKESLNPQGFFRRLWGCGWLWVLLYCVGARSKQHSSGPARGHFVGSNWTTEQSWASPRGCPSQRCWAEIIFKNAPRGWSTCFKFLIASIRGPKYFFFLHNV